MARIDAVSVIEFSEGTVLGVHSYTDDNGGNIQAEWYFRKLIMENYPEMTEDEIKVCTEDGVCDKNTWSLYLVHSCQTKKQR